MMQRTSQVHTAGINPRVLAILAVALVVAVFLITWISIDKSRSDSMELLEAQGKAFTEALALASQNAITAATFYDNLVRARYGDLVATLVDANLDKLSDQDLVSFALTHDLLGVYIYSRDAGLVTGVVARGPREALPEFVEDEIEGLFGEPENNYVLLLEPGETTGEERHYFLELTGQLDAVVVLVMDALYYTEALRQTGIGYLAQSMAQESGVEYIIYQSTEGIIVSSRKPGDLLSIESDPFLSEALDSDTIMSRVFNFQGKDVLELVRPFSTSRYPFGLFRVGQSLDGYYSVSRGFDKQVVILSGTLLLVLFVAFLYINSRRKRQELGQRYTDIKSVTNRILEQMRTGVGVIDGSGVIRLTNPAFEQVFAVRGAEGRPFREVLSRYADLLDSFVDGDVPADETEAVIEVNGERRTVLMARSKLFDERREATSVVMVVYDITRLKQYERQAVRKERLSEMGNLAAGVAHEIRNPLNTISIAAQRLASEFSPTENAEQYLAFTSQIRAETSRLNEIITRFLALAREEKKKRQTVVLPEFFEEMEKLLKVEGDRLGIAVTVESEPGLKVEADPDGLKEVFLNLFNNSKEALAGNPGTFSIKATAAIGQVMVTVSDNGPGIAPELQDKVFAPYYTSKEAGTGLGLAAVQRIVSEHGGDVRLEGGRDSGARFVITLPVLRESES